MSQLILSYLRVNGGSVTKSCLVMSLFLYFGILFEVNFEKSAFIFAILPAVLLPFVLLFGIHLLAWAFIVKRRASLRGEKLTSYVASDDYWQFLSKEAPDLQPR